MSKNINAGTINDSAIAMLSAYNQATLVLRAITAQNKTAQKALEQKRKDIVEKRKKAAEDGMKDDEITSTYSLVNVDNEIRALAEKYRTECKPWKDALANARKLIPNDLYESYKIGYQKGQIDQYGINIRTFLKAIGIEIPTIQQEAKLARTLIVRTSGARKATVKKAEQGFYISEKSKAQYADIFMLAILEWLIKDKKVLKVSADHTLTKVEYNNK